MCSNGIRSPSTRYSGAIAPWRWAGFFLPPLPSSSFPRMRLLPQTRYAIALQVWCGSVSVRWRDSRACCQSCPPPPTPTPPCPPHPIPPLSEHLELGHGAAEGLGRLYDPPVWRVILSIGRWGLSAVRGHCMCIGIRSRTISCQPIPPRHLKLAACPDRTLFPHPDSLRR